MRKTEEHQKHHLGCGEFPHEEKLTKLHSKIHYTLSDIEKNHTFLQHDSSDENRI